MQKERLKPIAYDKDGPIYSEQQATLVVVDEVQQGTYFKRRAKRMSRDLAEAEELINKSTDQIERAIERLLTKEGEFSQASKKASGRVRDATQKLSDGLARIEKVADFDRLNRYAGLLERIEKSLSTLAELEQRGLLDKVSKALK